MVSVAAGPLRSLAPWPAVVAAVALLVLPGCGDDDPDRDASATPTADAAAEPGAGAVEDPDDAEDTADDTGLRADDPVLPERFALGDAAFLDPPDPLPGDGPGDLLRLQPSELEVAGATVSRILYRSEAIAGDAIGVTGLLVVPDGDPPAGGWPLVTHGHGSTGIADVCAPSITPDEAVEVLLLGAFAAERGVAVVSSDYEGLGTPGRHPMLVGESEGRSVLDAARAAQQVPDVDLADTVGIAGYSQGGHAALWAAQLAPTWAPELDIVGAVAGAPGAVVAPVTSGWQSTRTDPPDAAIAANIIAGHAAAYPDADPAQVLTEAGLAYIDTLDDSCRGDLPDPTVALFTVDPTTVEPWGSLLAGSEPGATATDVPMLVVHSAEDLWVPSASVDVAVDRLCSVGDVVEQRTLPTGDHLGAAVPSYEQGLDWLRGLMAGTATPAPSCPE